MTEVLMKSPSSGSGSNILSMQRFQGLQLEPPTRDVSISGQTRRPPIRMLIRFRQKTDHWSRLLSQTQYCHYERVADDKFRHGQFVIFCGYYYSYGNISQALLKLLRPLVYCLCTKATWRTHFVSSLQPKWPKWYSHDSSIKVDTEYQ